MKCDFVFDLRHNLYEIVVWQKGAYAVWTSIVGSRVKSKAYIWLKWLSDNLGAGWNWQRSS